MGEKFTTQRATKVATGGFPVAGCWHRAVELTEHEPSETAAGKGVQPRPKAKMF